MSGVVRDWLVTFARKVAQEREYSADHPGHVFLVMLKRDEAEGLLSQANAAVKEGEHFCETEEAGWRPCPSSLCEARRLLEYVLGLREELRDRRVCLVAARDDLRVIQNAQVEDGGLWLKSIAQARERLVDEAIANTDAALVATADAEDGEASA